MDAVYVELAKRIGLGHTKGIPELFSMIADADDAELLLALPGNAPTMAAKLGRPEAEVADRLTALFHKGLVFPSFRTDPPTYRMCRDLVQFHDATILWPEAPRSFLDRWQEFMETEWPAVAKIISGMTPRSFTRVIPVGVTVEARSHVLAFEDIQDIVEKADRLAVTKCTCRLIAHKCDAPLEACIQINNAAQYSISRGTGREITKDQALDIVRRCEEAGLIHVVMNKQSVDHFICNCCACCCQTMPILIQHGISVIEPSRFRAVVDPERCSGCETCLDRCFFGAVTMASYEGLEEDERAQVDPDKCLGCGLCQVTCPEEAISLTEVRPLDYVPLKLFG